MSERRPPPNNLANYLAILIGVAGVVLSALSLMQGAEKASREDWLQTETRLCQLEMIQFRECKRK